MPTLKEIKGRIGSVKNTLKITSAMKLVSSAKLRKAQNAIEAMRPYEEQLLRILSTVSPVSVDEGGLLTGSSTVIANSVDGGAQMGGSSTDKAISVDRAGAGNGVVAGEGVMAGHNRPSPTVIVAIASNSSLCGGFNANAIAKVRSLRRPGDIVYSIGRKMADAMRKDGFPSPEDFTALSEHPSYSPASALVDRLSQDLAAGRIGRVLLVYNHFVSTARQVPVVETLLGGIPGQAGNDGRTGNDGPAENDGPAGKTVTSSVIPSEASVSPAPADVIIEPSKQELLAILLPKTLKLKLYAALLDSAAAEHAARTVAMQTATDNGNQLLDELTLQYNKGRQQKITNEILDLAGGQAAD